MILPDFKTTITLFTKYYDSTNKKTIWYKWNINNCFYGLTRSQDFLEQDLYKANSQLVRIPKLNNFKEYNEWVSLPAENKSDFISITLGSLIFKGEISGTIADNNNGNSLLNKYSPNCFTINVFRNNTNIIRLAEHYYGSGS